MKWVKKIIEVVLLCITIFCFGKVILKQIDYSEAKQTYNEIEEISKETVENSVDEKDGLLKKYNKMKEINKEYYGWINVKNTNINYPIVKSKDNLEYLKLDFKKNANSSGAIFLDYRNKADDFNTIIHGHHMKNGTMFNNLIKYKDKNFFENNKEVKISFKDKEETYEIFSAYVADANEGYLERNYSKEYVEYIKNKSLFKNDTIIKKTDKIITLSTCSYEFEDARMVVHAIKK